jgi:hypothetical protein
MYYEDLSAAYMEYQLNRVEEVAELGVQQRGSAIIAEKKGQDAKRSGTK